MEGKDVRDGNSCCSRERQTNKWLTRRIQEFHPSAFRLSGLGKASRNRESADCRRCEMRENAQRSTSNTEHSTTSIGRWQLSVGRLNSVIKNLEQATRQQ